MRSTSAALKPRVAEAAPPAEPVPPPASAPYQFEIVRTRAAFDALAAEWDALFARAGRSAQLFQQFNWNWHWCNHYLDAAGPSLAVLTVRRAETLVAVWPLVTVRVAGLTRLTWMGAPVSQYGDVLVDAVEDPLALLRAGWAHVVASTKPDVVDLARVRADAAIAPLLAELGALQTRLQQAPYLDLKSAPDFPAYMQRHSAKSRKKSRAAARKLTEQGAQFTKSTGGEASRNAVAAAIVSKHEQLLERGIISPALADPRMQRFFADAAAGNQRPAQIVVYALEFDGEKAATDVLIDCKGRIATHIFAYETKYAKERVGAYLLERTIEEAFADGRDTFDLLAPADDYKLRWADGTVDVVDWAVPISPKGRAYARIYLRALRPMLKSVISAMPASVNRLLAAAYARRKSVS